ncbi:MAG: FGGY-family carbohydrate kinase [Nevskia sp.]|nr:FGGY-family carbohydrate kinase [Nevskia sp.]
MSGEALLAIDVGTQSVRAIVFDPRGHLLAKAQVPLEPAYASPQPGWAEQDPQVYWQAMGAACRQLWRSAAVTPGAVAGVALTTIRGSAVFADAAGRPLRPAILWLDQRRAGRLPPLSPYLRLALAAAGAGGLVRHFQLRAQANWVAEHEPGLWRSCERYGLLSAYLTHRLTGEWVDSAAAQVGYLPFDYKRQRWAAHGDFKWRALSLRPEQLPVLHAPGERMGALTAAAAAELGLPQGLPVVAAAADKACEVLGCGAVAPDVAQLSFGTTATINTTQPRYVEVQRMLPAYPAALPGAFNTEIQIYRGFWMVSWFRREFGQPEVARAAELGVPAERLFDALAAGAPPGSMGLVLQPYWSPGVREPGPEAKGAVIGFGDVHTRAHLYRAILEGLAYGLRAGREQIERRLGRRLTRVVASGGGSQSDAAMQIAADVFGCAVERPENHESAALGAAMNLAVGLGLHADHGAAVAAMARSGQHFEPDAGRSGLYDALYREVYLRMYKRLRPLYRCIRRITGYPP